MKVLTYMIIDSCTKSIAQLRKIADEVQELQFLGQAQSANEALDLVLQHKPQLLLLSLNFNDKQNQLTFDFIDMLYKCLITMPKVVVVSDTKELAYEAINYQVAGYLLKPLKRIDFHKLIHILLKNQLQSKIQQSIARIDNSGEVSYLSPGNQAEGALLLCVKSYGDYRYIRANEVVYFKADNNSTDIYLHSGEMVTAFKTLKHFEGLLKEPFYRIHNSYLINSNFLLRIHLGSRSCTLRNSAKKIPFSKSYRTNIDNIIAKFSNENCLEV